MFQNLRHMFGLMCTLLYMAWEYGMEVVQRRMRRTTSEDREESSVPEPIGMPNLNGDIFSIPFGRAYYPSTITRGLVSIQPMETGNALRYMVDSVTDEALADEGIIPPKRNKKTKPAKKTLLYRVLKRCMSTGNNYKPKVARFHLPKIRPTPGARTHTRESAFQFFSSMGSRHDERVAGRRDPMNDALNEMLRESFVSTMASRPIITATQGSTQSSQQLSDAMRQIDQSLEDLSRSLEQTVTAASIEINNSRTGNFVLTQDDVNRILGRTSSVDGTTRRSR